MFVCFNLLIFNLLHPIRDEFDVLSLPSEGGFGTAQIKTIASVKGQLILKLLFGIFNSPKKQTRKFDFTTMDLKLNCFRLFFGRIEGTKKTFRN